MSQPPKMLSHALTRWEGEKRYPRTVVFGRWCIFLAGKKIQYHDIDSDTTILCMTVPLMPISGLQRTPPVPQASTDIGCISCCPIGTDMGQAPPARFGARPPYTQTASAHDFQTDCKIQTRLHTSIVCSLKSHQRKHTLSLFGRISVVCPWICLPSSRHTLFPTPQHSGIARSSLRLALIPSSPQFHSRPCYWIGQHQTPACRWHARPQRTTPYCLDLTLPKPVSSTDDLPISIHSQRLSEGIWAFDWYTADDDGVCKFTIDASREKCTMAFSDPCPLASPARWVGVIFDGTRGRMHCLRDEGEVNEVVTIDLV
ncbi:hypothetical protein L210DRAFT_3204720 [Boletus edulis BED1]|uniref:Uncharacterized protein n=1 Tax=Boletus edulis BED1 TaxID=1328754 RepID=A0AAD4BWX6_BOLED|nr:hypothetical protein L210DRAFT_3204720 [Boletus edulis BED1]